MVLWEGRRELADVGRGGVGPVFRVRFRSVDLRVHWGIM